MAGLNEQIWKTIEAEDRRDEDAFWLRRDKVSFKKQSGKGIITVMSDNAYRRDWIHRRYGLWLVSVISKALDITASVEFWSPKTEAFDTSGEERQWERSQFNERFRGFFGGWGKERMVDE